MSKRLPAFGVLAIGVVLLIVLFANNLFTVGSAFESLTDAFRPIMTDESISAAQSDVALLGEVAAEFESGQVAEAFGMPPDQLQQMMRDDFPAVAAGTQALPNIVPQFTAVVNLLADQQSNFESADAIPTSSLPASTVPWIILLIGIGAVVVGILMLGNANRAWFIATAFGVAVVAFSLLLSFLPKSNAADDMNDALKPVYNAELVAESGGAVGLLRTMGTEMQEKMIPALGLTEDQLAGVFTALPATGAALEGLGDSLTRFQSMVSTFDTQLDNYDTIKGTALYPIALIVLVGGFMIVACGIWRFIVDRREDHPVAEPTAP